MFFYLHVDCYDDLTTFALQLILDSLGCPPTSLAHLARVLICSFILRFYFLHALTLLASVSKTIDAISLIALTLASVPVV